MTIRRNGLTRRSLIATAALAPAFASGAASAQTPWPTPRINLIVPFPAGGSTDAVARRLPPCVSTGSDAKGTLGVHDGGGRACRGGDANAS